LDLVALNCCGNYSCLGGILHCGLLILTLNNFDLKKIETGILILIIILFFLTIKLIIPSFFVIFGIILLSIYFFPVKLIKNDTKKFSSLLLYSDILISLSLPVLIVGLYIDIALAISIVTIVNFVFLIFFVFKNKLTFDQKNIHYNIVINHFIIIFLLIMAREMTA